MHTSEHACVHTRTLQGKTANQNSERVAQINRQRNHGMSTTQLPTIKSLSSGLTAASHYKIFKKPWNVKHSLDNKKIEQSYLKNIKHLAYS
jgi:hypothetical protein